MPRLEQTILWRRLDVPGHDACGLWKMDECWRLEGTAVFAFEGRPCHLAYAIECDAAWITRSARVTGWIGREAVDLTIAVTGGYWQLNGIDQQQVAGCMDVDLGFTPATNLIALCRLALQIDEEADAPAAWLSFPELEFVRLRQHYRRIDENRYEYASPDTGYAGTLEVNEAGFIKKYPGLWEVESL